MFDGCNGIIQTETDYKSPMHRSLLYKQFGISYVIGLTTHFVISQVLMALGICASFGTVYSILHGRSYSCFVDNISCVHHALLALHITGGVWLAMQKLLAVGWKYKCWFKIWPGFVPQLYLQFSVLSSMAIDALFQIYILFAFGRRSLSLVKQRKDKLGLKIKICLAFNYCCT